MQIRGFASVVTFAAALVVMAGQAPPASGHAGNNNPGVIHACVGSFGGIRIVGVNGTCAATETPLHLNTADRPTAFAAEQTADAVATAPDFTRRLIQTTIQLANPATVDFKADGVVFREGATGCMFLLLVNGAIAGGREITSATSYSNWTLQANGVQLPAGTHSIALDMSMNDTNGQCTALAGDLERAKLWGLLR